MLAKIIPRRLRHFLESLFYRLRHRELYESIILVYTMGKVASSSVYSTLRKKFPGLKVFHVHFLSDHWLDQKLPTYHSFFHSNISLGKNILNEIERNPGKRIKVITLVREPVIREISDIFENAPGTFGKEVDLSTIDLEEFMDKKSFDYPLNWFDTEFKNYLNFDVYSLPFDKSRGYSIYQCSAADVLCIKAEALNVVYKPALKEFLGIDNFALHNSNTSEKKVQRDLYTKLRSSYKVAAEKLKVVYNSKYMRHFYTDEEIDGFIRTWQKPNANS